MSEQTELKPCPICGSDAEIDYAWVCNETEKDYHCDCSSCGIRVLDTKDGTISTREQAIMVWNQLPRVAELEAEVKYQAGLASGAVASEIRANAETLSLRQVLKCVDEMIDEDPIDLAILGEVVHQALNNVVCNKED